MIELEENINNIKIVTGKNGESPADIHAPVRITLDMIDGEYGRDTRYFDETGQICDLGEGEWIDSRGDVHFPDGSLLILRGGPYPEKFIPERDTYNPQDDDLDF